MRTLTLIADDMAKNLGRLFIQVLVFCATLDLSMIVTVVYAIGRVWQTNARPPARVCAPDVRCPCSYSFEIRLAGS